MNFAHEDNAQGQLNAGINASTLTIPLKTGEGALFPATISGQATSGGSAILLNDTGIGASGIAVGDIIHNITDGSQAVVVAVNANDITTTELRGGSDNTWQNSDSWAVGRFVITLIQYDTDGETILKREKVLIDSRSGDNLTVNASGRGYDGTTATTFDADDYVYLLWTSSSIDGIDDTLSRLIRDVQDLDDALALKANDADVVHDTGAETVAGVKTFSSFPILPSSDPTTDYQAAHRAFVLANGAPVTTKGDLVTHSGSAAVRLAVGSDYQVLRARAGATNGIEWASAQLSVAREQKLYGTTTEVDNALVCGNSDGTIIIAVFNPINAVGIMGTQVVRYAFDTISGTYYRTHEVSGPTIANAGAWGAYPVVIGSYVYVVYESGTNVVGVQRLDLANLANAASMTFSGGTISHSDQWNVAFTDGTNLYIQRASATTQANKYTISGTTLTYDSAITYNADLFDGDLSVGYSNGTHVWAWTNNDDAMATFLLAGTAGTKTTFGKIGGGSYFRDQASGSSSWGVRGIIPCPNQSGMFYLAFFHNEIQEVISGTASEFSSIVLVPFQKISY